MVKLPVVDIFAVLPLVGTDFEERLLVVDGASVGRSSLASFSYTYKQSGDDKGHFILRFDHVNIDISALRRGNYLRVRWGYSYQPADQRLSQLVAIDKLHVTYNKSGLSIKVLFLSIAGFKMKHPNQIDNAFDSLSEEGITIYYEYYNPISKSTIQYIYSPAHGTRTYAEKVRKDKQDEAQDYDDRIKDAKKGVVTDDPNWVSSYGSSPFSHAYISGVSSGFSGPDSETHKVLSEKGYRAFRQKIQEALAKAVLAKTGDFLMSTRDQGINITTDISQRAPITGIRPSGVISITYKELPKKLTTAYTSVVSVNPTTGEVKTETSHVYRGGSKIYRFSKTHKTFVEYDIVYQDGVYGTKQYNPSTGEEFIPLSAEDQELFIKSSKEMSKRMESVNSVHAHMDQEQYYTAQGIPKDAMQRDLDSLEYEGYEKYRTGAFTREDIGVEGDGTAIIARVVPGDTVSENNRIVQERLIDFFHATGVSIVMEGDPKIFGNYNFALADFVVNFNGVYVALDTTHAIIKGKYITTILGGRIPENITSIVAEVQESIDDRSKRIVEKYSSLAKPEDFFNIIHWAGDEDYLEEQYYPDETPSYDFSKDGTEGAKARKNSTKYYKDRDYKEVDSKLDSGDGYMKTIEMSDIDLQSK